jgi:pimeloyl-ACP methyl ester carboxylesterase
MKTSAGDSQYMAAYEGALKLWPVPYESMVVSTRLGSTHLLASGSQEKPPLVLLHGAGNSATMWYPIIAELSAQYRTVALDTIGDGEMSRLSRMPEERAEYAGWLEDVFAALGIDQAFLVGLSYGGWLALNLALCAPRRVKKMALLAPAASFQRFSFVTNFFLRFGFLLPVQPSAESTMRMLTAKGTQVDPRYIAVLDAVGKGSKMQILFPDVYTDEELRSIGVPARLIYGDQEVIYNTRKAADRARRLMPQVEVEFIQNAGHFLPMDQPGKVAGSILSFFAR